MTGKSGSVARHRAAAVTTVGAVAGAGYAILQLAIQLTGSAHPRTWISIAIALVGGAAGFLVNRIRVLAARRQAQADREDERDALVRYWPTPRVAETNPYELGVFPSDRPPGVAQPAYIERDLDREGEFDQALREEFFVVLFGPGGAGKSRTAFEAARRTHPDAKALVPESGESLRSLAVLDPPLEPEGARTILWLDGLERYLPNLAGDVLAALRRTGPQITVLATIRADDYRQALTGTGENSAAARRVLASARGFHLPCQLTSAERARAEEAYPGVDFSDGIGPAVSANWPSGHRPTAPLPPPPPAPSEGARDWLAGLGERFHGVVRTTGGLFRDAVFDLSVAGVVLSVVLLFLLWWFGGFSEEKSSIPDEVKEIRLAGSHRSKTHPEGRNTLAVKLDLRGTGEDSYLFLFHDPNLDKRGSPSDITEASDEINIYDLEGDKLIHPPRFRFHPTSDAVTFSKRATADFDHNGAVEIVGGLAREHTGQLLPVIIFFNERDQKYDIAALMAKKPSLARVTGAGRRGRRARAGYTRRMEVDGGDGHTVRGFRSTDFDVITSRSDPRLVAAFALRPRTPAQNRLLEVQAWRFDFSKQTPKLGPRCAVLVGKERRRIFVEALRGFSVRKLVVGRWKPFNRDAIC